MPYLLRLQLYLNIPNFKDFKQNSDKGRAEKNGLASEAVTRGLKQLSKNG